jgi:branched-chain amino acid transport system ATP-binding protein
MGHVLEIKGLKKAFGGIQALGGVDFHIDENEIVSVIGPNGAGKTSFFNVVSGLFPPDEGEILFKGEEIGGMPPNQITSLGLARTFQNVRLFPNLTVLENVMVGRHCRTKAGPIRAVIRDPLFRKEEEEILRKAEEALGFFGTRLVGYRFDQPVDVIDRRGLKADLRQPVSRDLVYAF